MIPAGGRDRLITLQDRAAGVDGLGNPNGAWQDTAKVWAKYTPVRGTEEFLKTQKYAETEATFGIIHRSGINARTQILFDGKTWDIVGVLEIGRREGLQLLAKAAANV